MGYELRTEKDIEKLLGKHSRLIVKDIKAITTKEEPDPGRRFEISLIEPILPEDYKGFMQRLMILINEMEASEVKYKPERNSIIFWYD